MVFEHGLRSTASRHLSAFTVCACQSHMDMLSWVLVSVSGPMCQAALRSSRPTPVLSSSVTSRSRSSMCRIVSRTRCMDDAEFRELRACFNLFSAGCQFYSIAIDYCLIDA